MEDQDEGQLSDFEAGFLLGYFAARGIDGEPTIDQFNEAASALADAKKRLELERN
jgi:hypothetical protein